MAKVNAFCNALAFIQVLVIYTKLRYTRNLQSAYKAPSSILTPETQRLTRTLQISKASTPLSTQECHAQTQPPAPCAQKQTPSHFEPQAQRRVPRPCGSPKIGSPSSPLPFSAVAKNPSLVNPVISRPLNLLAVLRKRTFSVGVYSAPCIGIRNRSFKERLCFDV